MTCSQPPPVPGSLKVGHLLNRMNSGHERVLRAAKNGEPFGNPNMSAGEMRGLKKVHETLLRWKALDGRGLSDVGHALLDAVDSRKGR